jgi:hypothetical protein
MRQSDVPQFICRFKVPFFTAYQAYERRVDYNNTRNLQHEKKTSVL